MAAAREKLQTREQTVAAPNSDHTSVLVLNVCVSVECVTHTCASGKGGEGQVPEHSISTHRA